MRLIADNLACERGGRLVFTGLTFSLSAGDMLELRGANGSGKTTLLRLIAGLCDPAGGTLRLDPAPDDLTIGQVSHLIAHQDALKPALTVAENLAFWSAFLGGGLKGEDVEAGLAAFGLEPLRHTAAALLSAGQKHRASLSRLKLVHRALWLLDEPSLGLDARSVARLTGHIEDHLRAGGMVIATTHVDLGIAGARVFDLDGKGKTG